MFSFFPQVVRDLGDRVTASVVVAPLTVVDADAEEHPKRDSERED